MASNLGTVFVELSLDDRIYKQKLSEIKPNVEATAKGIETAWRALGTKSSEVFDAQRRSIENAYMLIKKSATSTADDIVRAEQAKNAKMTSLNEAQYGHHASMLETLKKNWIAAAGAIVAAWALVSKAWTLAGAAAAYNEQMSQLDGLARKYGTTAGAIVANIKAMSEGLVSMSTASQVAMAGISKGLTPEMLYNLAKAATTLSDVMGTTADEAFTRMSEALTTNKEKSIKLAVGLIDLKDKYGKAADSMTDAEKQLALYNMIMEKTNAISKQMGGNIDSTADKMERMRVTVKDLNLMLGQGLLRAAAGAMGVLQGMASLSLAVSAGVFGMLGQFGNMRAAWEASKNVGSMAVDNMKVMVATTQELSAATAASTLVNDANAMSIGKIEAMQKAEAEALKATLKDKIAALKVEEENLKAKATLWKDHYEQLKNLHDTATNSMKEKTKELAKLESDRATNEASHVTLMMSLQEKLMMAQGKAATDQSIYKMKLMEIETNLAAAQQLTGEAQIKALEAVKAKYAEMTTEVTTQSKVWDEGSQKWIDKLKVVVTQEDAIKAAMSNVESVQRLITIATIDAKQAKEAEIEKNKEWATDLEAAMAKAKAEMDSYNAKIKEIAQVITKLGAIEVSIKDNATGPLNQIKALLDSIQNKTVTVTVNQVTTGASGVPAAPATTGGVSIESILESGYNTYLGGGGYVGGESAPASGAGASLDVGMDYVPRDNFPARLHKGEAVLTKQEATAWRSGTGGQVINFSPTISIPGAGKSAEQLAREIVKPLRAEMRRLEAVN